MLHAPFGLVVFGPQTRAPSVIYLQQIRQFILEHHVLSQILPEIHKLYDVQSLLVAELRETGKLQHCQEYTKLMVEWLIEGHCEHVASISSAVVALPRLAIIQVAQYFQYLESAKMTHSEMVDEVREHGGFQGFCGGLPAAFALASTKSDGEEMVQLICSAIRIAYAIGLCAELGDDSRTPGTTTMIVRQKQPGPKTDELCARFPNVHISAITDRKTFSVVGPPSDMAKFEECAVESGSQVQAVSLRGKTHHPDNARLASALAAICEQSPLLRFPSAERLVVGLRSNIDGHVLAAGPLAREMIQSILCTKCDWYNLVTEVAKGIKHAGVLRKPSILTLGIGDCIPLNAFHELDLVPVPVRLDSQKSLSAREYHHRPDAVAIIGASCRLPGAANLEELYDLVAAGKDQHQPLDAQRFDLGASYRAQLSDSAQYLQDRKFYVNTVEGVGDFDHAFFGISKREMPNMDPQQRLLLQAAFEAIDSSGYAQLYDRTAGHDVGCFIGASFVDYLDNTNAHAPSAYTSIGTIRAFLCGRLSHYFGWTGPAEVLDTACSSSLVAINRAVKAVQSGECSLAVAGGVNLITSPGNFMDLGRAGFLSPSGQCKPFDQNADGYCRAEGIGLVVLKPLHKAEADGDDILAVIPASATNQGGMSRSLTIPDAPALSLLYQSVLRAAHMAPETVTYVEAHGTGTQAGDPVEMASIRSVFGAPGRKHELFVGSIKGNIGHCETAAGIAGLLKVVCMLRGGIIPPQVNYSKLNPKIPALSADCVAISSGLRPWDAPFRAALINSYGAAGSNASLLCTQAPPRLRDADETVHGASSPETLPFIISAASRSSLQAYCQVLSDYLRRSGSTDAGSRLLMRRLAYTLSERRRRQQFFVTFTAESAAEAAGKLSSQNACIIERSPAASPVVFVFPGQSKQTINLSEQFYRQQHRFRHYLEECNSKLVELQHPAIVPAVFAATDVQDVVVLQTGLVAVQYAMAMTWIDAGVRPSRLVGHSLGELAALAVGGVLSIKDCLRLVAARATLIQRRWGLDRGAMLAVFAERQSVERALEMVSNRREGKLDMACYNAPGVQVVAGSTDAIARLEAALGDEFSPPIAATRVRNSHAFHSSLVEPVLPYLDEVSASLSWAPALWPIEFSQERRADAGTPYSPARHMREPVFFAHAVQRVECELGNAVWMEIAASSGAGGVSLTKKALAQPEGHRFLAAPAETQSDCYPARSCCELWSHSIAATPWLFLLPLDVSAGARVTQLPPYRFDADAVHGWLPHTDHAAALRQQLDEWNRAGAGQAAANAMRVPPLVDFAPGTTATSTETSTTFALAREHRRFREIVTGHAVRGRPLCPASMYVECVVAAVRLLHPDVQCARVELEGLQMLHPLTATGPPVHLVLTPDQGQAHRQTWTFTVASVLPEQGAEPRAGSRRCVHATGTVRHEPAARTNVSAEQRMANLRMREMEASCRDDDNAETLAHHRAYALFSRVVTYQALLKGISRVTMRATEAVATVNIPAQQPAGDDEALLRAWDAVSMDNFIQVAGLLMNTSQLVEDLDVMVCTGVERCHVSQACDLVQCKSWKVYTVYTATTPTQATGDVFVFSADGLIVASWLGCDFKKLTISRLEHVLDSTAGALPRPDRQSSAPAMAASMECSPPATADDVDMTPSTTPSTDSFADRSNINLRQQIIEILVEASGINPSLLEDSMSLADIGIDSLAMADISSAIAKLTSGNVQAADVLVQSTISDVLRLCDRNKQMGNGATTKLDSFPDRVAKREQHHASGSATLATSEGIGRGGSKVDAVAKCWDPLLAIRYCETRWESAARSRGYVDYWKDVAERQSQIVLAYVVEAFARCRVELLSLPNSSVVPTIEHLPRHDKLIDRLLQILEKHQVVAWDGKQYVAAGGVAPRSLLSSAELHHAFIEIHPDFAIEAELMNITGPKLADCLQGRIDPVKLLFGCPRASECLETYYSSSPMLATLTLQLVDFIIALVQQEASARHSKLRILEVGAGTGGTTSMLAKALSERSIEAEYVFTDVSTTLLAKSRMKLSQYHEWMSFERLDLEQEVPGHMKAQFDIIIATNCVHATRDRSASCGRLKEMLNGSGVLVLSEVTRVIDWYDLVFGLLDGWWLAADGPNSYPLQPAESWASQLRGVGFSTVAYTYGPTEDANTQQLILATKAGSPKLTSQRHLSPPTRPEIGKLTVVYHTVGDVDIEADIYLPATVRLRPMPVALLLHGGGHMTLSKNEVRPWQISHLLAHDILPISLNYRLCPEVNIVDGAMADVCSAFVWVKSQLQSFLNDNSSVQRGVTVDTERIVVIGWSTGGHLAMSTAWTVPAAGLKPPVGILSFYAPLDFVSLGVFPKHSKPLFTPSLTTHDLMEAPLEPMPLTECNTSGGDDPEIGWAKPGHLRAELLLSFFGGDEAARQLALSVMLNGKPGLYKTIGACIARQPSLAQVQSICPTTHLLAKNYSVPTFIIHGEQDVIAPFEPAAEFHRHLVRQGLKCGFRGLEGREHLFDLRLKPGSPRWDSDVAPGYAFLFDLLHSVGM